MTDNEAGLVDGKRGRSIRARDRRLMRPFIGAHRRIIQASSSRVLARIGGHPLLVLTTTGRRSGQPRSTPVIGIPEGEGWFIVASKTNTYLARILPQDERDRCWPALVRAYPAYNKMQAKTDRPLPVVQLQPATGSGEDRHDLDA
jgi:hypothetical protein